MQSMGNISDLIARSRIVSSRQRVNSMLSLSGVADNSASIRVIVVDRFRLLAEAFKAVCTPITRVNVVGTGTRADQLTSLIEMYEPQVVLLDADFCDERLEQLWPQAQLSRPRLRLVLLDDTVHDARVKAAMRLGAAGYWTKQESFAEITDRISRIAAGETVYCPSVESRLINDGAGIRLAPAASNQFRALTAREFELLPHLARGLSVKQVASMMSLSPSTVDNHKSRIMKKLNVHKTAELTRIAIREGVIST
jgi:DNA-binding NarL/FixJ family response regulator